MAEVVRQCIICGNTKYWTGTDDNRESLYISTDNTTEEVVGKLRFRICKECYNVQYFFESPNLPKDDR